MFVNTDTPNTETAKELFEYFSEGDSEILLAIPITLQNLKNHYDFTSEERKIATVIEAE